jgi:AAA domain
MIKSIEITNLGSFVRFTNNEATFEQGGAIIHGMNGSGKSQLCSLLQLVGRLSRVPERDQNRFRRAQQEIVQFVTKRKSKDNDESTVTVHLDACSIEIDTANGAIATDGPLPSIFVFNDDYVASNIGETVDLPERQIRIGETNKLRDDLQSGLRKIRGAISAVEDSIDRKIDQARQASGYATQSRTLTTISKDNYLRAENPSSSYPNARDQLENLFSPPSQITSHIGQTFPELTIPPEERQRIGQIFSTAYVEPQLQQSVYQRYLQPNKRFYEDGAILLRELKTTCPFCLSPKEPRDVILGELVAYIESEYNDAQNSLTKLSSRLAEYRETFSQFISRSNKGNPAIRSALATLNLKADLPDIDLDDALFDVQSSLIPSKLSGMANTGLLEEVSFGDALIAGLTKIRGLYNEKLRIIAVANDEVERLTSRKRSLGEEIIKNGMHELWNDSALRDRLLSLTLEQRQVEQQLSELPQSGSGHRTVGLFNQIIKQLGVRKYKLTDQSRLVLKLHREHDISNEGFRISTGERKCIAFSYFLAEVLFSVNSCSDLGGVSVFLDDPIDSSDHEKFYSFVSVIENLESLLQSVYHNPSICFGQFLIFTHNALLYERLVNTRKFGCYLILNEDNRSIIRKPKKRISLVTFSSYLKRITKCIRHMDSVPGNEIGNYIRRILEIVASIENVDNNQIEGLNAFSRLNAITNHLSHESLERLLDPLPESHEYIEACIELVELIRTRIPLLYVTIRERYLDKKEIDEHRAEYRQRFQGA